MLEDAKDGRLPYKMLLSRAPCMTCSQELIKGFQTVTPKPTLHIGVTSVGSGGHLDFDNQHVQGQIALQHNGFKLTSLDSDDLFDLCMATTSSVESKYLFQKFLSLVDTTTANLSIVACPRYECLILLTLLKKDGKGVKGVKPFISFRGSNAESLRMVSKLYTWAKTKTSVVQE